MSSKTPCVLLTCVLAAVSAQAQTPALLAGEREALVTAIPGVVAAGAKWEIVWADFETADGIVGTADGGVLETGEVGALVQAMAGSSPFYNSSNPTLQNALAAAWDA